MATFKLDDKHRLRSDSRQWILEKLNITDKGVKNYSIIGYYSTLTGAINASYSYLLRKSDADDIRAFMDDSKRIFNKLVEVLSPVAEIKEK